MVPSYPTALYYLRACQLAVCTGGISFHDLSWAWTPLPDYLQNFSFVCIRVIHHLAANLAGRKTLCLQACTWKQRQMAAIQIESRSSPPGSWFPAVQERKGQGLLTSCPVLPGWSASRGLGLHFKLRGFFPCLLPGPGRGSSYVIESDKEKLLHTSYLLVSSCQEFCQKTLPLPLYDPLIHLWSQWPNRAIELSQEMYY